MEISMINNSQKSTNLTQESAQLVLQGEYGVSNGGFIKTSTPFTCVVVVAFSKEQPGVGFLSHVDDYTSPIDVVAKIIRVFNSVKPTIQILGEGQNLYARKHLAEISAIVNLLGMSCEKIPLKGYCDRPQIVFDTKNGKLSLLEGSKKDESLETFQKREFGEFNNFLSRSFSSDDGHEIPYFAAKETTRTIQSRNISPVRKVIPQDLETKILWNFLEIKSNQDDVPIPLKLTLQTGDLSHSIRLTSIHKSLSPILKFLITFRSRLGIEVNSSETTKGALDLASQVNNSEAISVLKSPAQTDEDLAIKQLETIIISDLNLPESLMAPFVDGNWNLLFKNSCQEESYVCLLKVLCSHLQLFSIDPKHKDSKNAPNALEIAMSRNNKSAIDLFIRGEIYSNKEIVQTNLKLLILKLSKDHDLLADWENNNYLSLLKRVAHSPKYLPILRAIVNNARILEVDIHTKEDKTKSALEIATQAKNLEAVKLLKP